MNDMDLATSFAICEARQRGSAVVAPDHILLGCLRAISRFGIATLGSWSLDLESLGVDWLAQPDSRGSRIAYSEETVDLFDRAAFISRSGGDSNVSVHHLLAAFATEETGLMAELKQAHGITSASWRAAIAGLAESGINGVRAEAVPVSKPEREYLTPEEAADALGIHVQTMRGYIRTGRLPAFRVAGERAIRIRRGDLEKVLEPLSVNDTKPHSEPRPERKGT